MLSPEITASKQAFRTWPLPLYHNPSKRAGWGLSANVIRPCLDPHKNGTKPDMLLERFGLLKTDAYY